MRGAGEGGLTLGVQPLQPEIDRLAAAGMKPGRVETADDYFLMRMTDPDGNRIIFASARRD